MSTTEAPRKMRAHVGSVTLSLGLASTLGSLFTTEEDNEEKFHLVCPDCTAPAAFLAQKYVCTENAKHGPFVKGEARSGQNEDGKIVVIDKAKLDEARASILPPRELELQVHSRNDVEAHTFSKGNVYVFQPTGKSTFYGVLRDILTVRRDIVLLAKMNLRNHDKMVMVDLENGQLVVREMMWPADCRPFPQIVTPPATKKELAQIEMLLDASLEPFDPAEYAKNSRARVTAVIEEAVNGPAPKGKKKAAPKLEDTDLEDLIAASIAQAQAKKKKPVKKAS